MRKLLFGCSALLLFPLLVRAQNFTTSSCQGSDGGSSSSWFFGHQERACELRRAILPFANGQVDVSATNGRIEVVGEDRRDVVLEARVEAQGSSRSDAASKLHEVRVLTNGTIHAEGPRNSGWFNGGWSVSYRLRVPHQLRAQLHTENGAISVTGTEGVMDIATTNGALALTDLTGDVHANTVNGGITTTLGGDRWRGAGLIAKTVNGPISVKAPGGYSAHLIARTVNGAIAVGFPITVQGAINHNLDTSIGQGGSTLQFETVNGGIAVGRGSGNNNREE